MSNLLHEYTLADSVVCRRQGPSIMSIHYTTVPVWAALGWPHSRQGHAHGHWSTLQREGGRGKVAPGQWWCLKGRVYWVPAHTLVPGGDPRATGQ